MGMYTQAKAVLNIGTAWNEEDLMKVVNTLTDVKEKFNQIHNGRAWVCESTTLLEGDNGALFIAFGTELKNYNDDIMEWLRFLVNYFKSAEGVITVQYEDDDMATVHAVYKGEITEDVIKIQSNGYENILEVE